MGTILLLVGLAILLAGLEVIVPGGLLGVISTIIIIIACVLSYEDYGVYGALGIFTASIILVVLVVFIELRLLSKSKYGKRLFLSSSSSGRMLSENEKVQLDGKAGVAITVLGPTGIVEIDGKQHEAFSQDGQLAKGDHVEVVCVDNFRVVVKRVD